MAPFVPYHISAGEQKLVKFGGLLTTEWLEPPPGRCFMMRQTYKHNVEGEIPRNLRAVIESSNRPKGPWRHFHKFQVEYFRVERGIMGLHMDGKDFTFTPEDGELVVSAGTIHNFSIHPTSPEAMTVYISAADAGMDRQLDRVYLENWYGYWHDVMLHEGGKFDMIQSHAIHDGGDVYPAGPSWLPGQRFIGYWRTVILGRWVGGLLGYRPYFREYTTDYAYAMAKLRGSRFQRHLVKNSWEKKAKWEQEMAAKVVRVSDRDNRYDQLTIDISPQPLVFDESKYQEGRWVGSSEIRKTMEDEDKSNGSDDVYGSKVRQ